MTRGILARDGDGNFGAGRNGAIHFRSARASRISRAHGSHAGLYGLETAGPRPANPVTRRTRINQAVARIAIQAELNPDQLQQIADFRLLETEAADKESHLNWPEAVHDCRPKADRTSRKGGKCKSSSRTVRVPWRSSRICPTC